MLNQCKGICKSGSRCKRLLKNIDMCQAHYEGECSICLTDIIDDKQKTKCGHFFHKECLDQWCVSKRTCPICRANIHEKVLYTNYRLHVYPEISKDFVIEIEIQHSDSPEENLEKAVRALYDIMNRDPEFIMVSRNEDYDIQITTLNSVYA